MKRYLRNFRNIALFLGAIVFSFGVNAQTQVGNSGFENWDDAGTSDEEPTNWSSFTTADCTLGAFICGFAQTQQVEQSTDAHTGTYSARIWSKEPISGTVANGNLTLGRVHMGSSTANDPSNYNYTDTGNPDFNQSFTGKPDSLAVWVKFTPQTTTDVARISATIHDNYDYRDPEDAAASSHVVAKAVMNYGTTNGKWKRLSIPFDYNAGPSTTAAYILITFTTNKSPGGGSKDDEVLVDDLQMIYNPAPTVNITPVAAQTIPQNIDGNTLTATESNGTATSRQWKSSNTIGGPYTSIAGETNLTYVPNFPNIATYYVVCVSDFSGTPVTSNEVKITVQKSAGLSFHPKKEISVYGFGNKLNVDLSSSSLHNATLQVVGMDGRVVASQSLKDNTLNTIQLNVPNGIYFYVVGNDVQLQRGKVFLQ